MFQKPVVLLTGFHVFRQRVPGNTALVSDNIFLLSYLQWLQKAKTAIFFKKQFCSVNKKIGLSQCPRTDLNKMFLPKPMTTTW